MFDDELTHYVKYAKIITGFVIFGKYFITLLYGESYETAYYMACILMIPVTIPLIQNVGLNIIQAKNKYKFRTVVFFFIAIANVMVSIPLAKLYGGIGAAMGTGLSLIIGQVIIMNVYYQKKIHINIIKFWKEILKMSIPVIICFTLGLFSYKIIGNRGIIVFILEIVVYTAIYSLLMWNFGMNLDEKNLFKRMVNIALKKGKKQHD